MNDFKTRLITEKDELSTKINGLEAFLSSEKVNVIDADQVVLLGIQLSAMITYAKCLTARLDKL